MNKRGYLLRPILLASALSLIACEQEVTGPAPSLSPDSATGAAGAPGYTCTSLPEATITVRSANFSPLVVDLLDEERSPSVRLPEVKLRRTATIEGEAQAGAEPIALRSSEREEDSDVRWISPEELRLRLTDSMALEPGIYDVSVTNANGNTTLAPSAFGVLPQPSLTSLAPELTCVAQGSRSIELRGDHLLMRGDERPVISLNGQDYRPNSMGEGRDLGAVFGGAQVCRVANIEIPAAALDAGIYTFGVTNPDPAACSLDPNAAPVRLAIAPAPTVSSIAP
jgi:hypothetical protein